MTGESALLHETFKPSGRPLRSEVFRAAIAPAVESLTRADPHLRIDDDPDSIHAARVATRKLRSELRLFRPMLDEGWVEEVRAGLKQLARLLGAVRDTDVVAERLRTLAKRLPACRETDIDPILERLRRIRKTACEVLRGELHAPWYTTLQQTLVAAASNTDGQRLSVPDVRMRRSAVVTRMMRPTWKELKRAVRSAKHEADAAHLHRIRIRAKACRYAAEAVGPFVPAARRAQFERFQRHIARLQQRLGNLRDAVLEESALRAIANHDSLAVGEIAALDTADAERTQALWRASWAKLSHRTSHFW